MSKCRQPEPDGMLKFRYRLDGAGIPGLQQRPGGGGGGGGLEERRGGVDKYLDLSHVYL